MRQPRTAPVPPRAPAGANAHCRRANCGWLCRPKTANRCWARSAASWPNTSRRLRAGGRWRMS